MMLPMDKIIRNSALPLLLMLAVALISSCTASREDDLRPAGGLTGLTLTITPEQPQVEELLRADSKQELEEENKITSVDVFVFNQAGTTLLGSARGKSFTSSSGGAVSVKVDNISYKDSIKDRSSQGGSDKPNPPTSDFAYAVAVVAVISLAGAVVIGKKAHR